MEYLLVLIIYAYPLLGAIQVLGALIRFAFGSERYLGYKDRLAKYLFGVFIYFAIMWLGGTLLHGFDHFNTLAMTYLFILPWGFVIYHCYTIFRIESDDASEFREEVSI